MYSMVIYMSLSWLCYWNHLIFYYHFWFSLTHLAQNAVIPFNLNRKITLSLNTQPTPFHPFFQTAYFPRVVLHNECGSLFTSTQTQCFWFSFSLSLKRHPPAQGRATRDSEREKTGDGEWKVFPRGKLFSSPSFVQLLFFSRSSLISPVFFISRRRHRRRLGRLSSSGGNDDVVDESGNGVCFSCCFRLLSRRKVFCLWNCDGIFYVGMYGF